MVRRARITDAKVIHQLLLKYAGDGLMLSRSLSDIYESIRDFYVYEQDGVVIATGCLSICWDDLAEVRSLAVAEGMTSKGVGRKIVAACLDEAREIGLKRVFALTYQLEFFQRLGFVEIEKSQLPHKVWGDCVRCPKFPECDELAVMINL
jgi:amino-acid N-acetyltransferase